MFFSDGFGPSVFFPFQCIEICITMKCTKKIRAKLFLCPLFVFRFFSKIRYKIKSFFLSFQRKSFVKFQKLFRHFVPLYKFKPISYL